MTQVPQAAAWFVTAMLVEAAIIDGRKLKVPNWLTYHLAFTGLGFAAWSGGSEGLTWSAIGAAAGLLCLLPLYAIGGMGAGDVKLMAGVGAWMGPTITLWAFSASTVAGALMAVVMVLRSGEVIKHLAMSRRIVHEVLTLKDPVRLAQVAAARKPTMMMLPYAIPIAVGSIGYFAYAGILF